MILRSLTGRVLLFASLWSGIAILTIALVISTLYRQASERNFTGLLRAQLNGVINAVSMQRPGQLAGSPELGDLAFAQPESGWYWLVEPIETPAATTGRLASPSLSGLDLAVPSTDAVPFDERYQRSYLLTDAAGNEIEVIETEVELDAGVARFRVAGNRDVLKADIDTFNASLFLSLGLFAFGSLLLNAVAILIGLRPLDRARLALGRIRNGEETRLTGTFPREIEPLAAEINALIESNARLVDRARKQVGNLAHSLKTPIAVLLNESRNLPPAQQKLLVTQLDAMRAQVQTYLDRARIAAGRGSVLARTDAEKAVARMLRVMSKLNPHLDFSTDITTAQGQAATLAVEQQDFEEMLGNLLENAARFARSKVTIRLRPASAPDAEAAAAAEQAMRQRPFLAVWIDDDGPGIAPEQRAEALRRGARLDESRPGTGLGLAIVAEIAGEYGGRFSLETAAAGGLSARLVLPGVFAET
ncbi:sensor histidine kinase [Pseudohoeflea coraliihabitans]|uniref:histidine kinase n=1 Tax=Pseudohoeflea coraliihabitans TaxID=2860393 RepID=A0ABS6WSA0_9HYPH|nr:HAMP domain-containing sensor histidine kinase [Pseudohoeflea sp. DP4N28-3]MBW3098675.1 HAMP domain-containing histidine kinase [Pseudohoeflea sp. DP4N28-3]